MPSEISYDPSLNGEAGYLKIENEINDDSVEAQEGEKQGKGRKKAIRPRDKQTLLHLMFYFIYTFEGRRLLRDNPPVNGKLGEPEKTLLRNKFNELGVTDQKVQNAILAVHESGNSWAQEYRKGAEGNARREDFEKIYLQQMAFLTWCLWEDAKGHEFSMVW